MQCSILAITRDHSKVFFFSWIRIGSFYDYKSWSHRWLRPDIWQMQKRLVLMQHLSRNSMQAGLNCDEKQKFYLYHTWARQELCHLSINFKEFGVTNFFTCFYSILFFNHIASGSFFFIPIFAIFFLCILALEIQPKANRWKTRSTQEDRELKVWVRVRPWIAI